MVLIVPLLGNTSSAATAATQIGVALLKATAMVITTLVVARYVVPKILGWVDASRSREVFLLAILGLCIGTAWLTSLAGLSLALGAFLGGMVVADTEYGHRAMGDILPLRDVRSIDEADQSHGALEGHVVIIGFGLAGRFAARAAR